MIIDCHCHVVTPEMSEDPASFGARDPHFAMMLETKGAKFLTGWDLLRDMEEAGVDRAVAFGYAFRDMGVSKAQNDHALSLAKESDGRIAAFAVVDPQAQGAAKEVERCLHSGAQGVGELFPDGHGFDLLGNAMARILGICRDADVPTVVHVSEPVGRDYPGKGALGPRSAYRLAVAYPKNKMVFAHLGGGLPFFSAISQVRGLEHVYYDTAAQPFVYKPSVYTVLRAAGMLDKVLFGSDYPLLSPKRYFRDIEASGISVEERSMVLGGNAEGLIGKSFTRK